MSKSSVVKERLPYIERLQLDAGSHPAPSNGLVDACVMEAVAYVAGEKFSDHPECASPILGQFLRSWNDSLNDQDRQMLKPYIVRLVDTNTGAADEETRAWMLTDWLAREYAPAFLRTAGLTGEAKLLESLAPFTSVKVAREQQVSLDEVKRNANAAGAAAGDAAWAAAWAAARAAAWDAAGAAAWAAAGDAARAAAWDAAWAAAGAAAWATTCVAAAGDAARAAAGAAAWAAAGDAAWAAARAAAWAAAGAAAWDAARAALRPTVDQLQQSALLLLDRMIDVSK